MGIATEVYVAIVACILSSIGSFLIILLNIRFSDYRSNFFRKLIWVLSSYDFLLTVLFFFPESNKNSCTFQSYSLVFAGSMAPNFSFCIAIITYLNISKNYPIWKLQKIAIYLHAASFCASLGIMIFSLFTAEVGPYPETYWCFIHGRLAKGFYYGMIWISCLGSTIMYILIVKKITQVSRAIERMMNLEDAKKRREVLRSQIRMSIIPLALIITWFFPSIRRGREIFSPDSKEIPWLNILQSLTNPLQGFLDCIVFVFCSKYSRDKLYEMFCCKEWKKSSSMKVISVSQEKKDPLLISAEEFTSNPSEKDADSVISLSESINNN
ncbi:g protein-coupled receptor [Anaeramoeba flamelloides]|uniref:G protein-coupled receptor n=1 Tax=Anaeramoeba flamelloides TaxID=1746091 RepID=A0AAV7YH51_9EUKA|nr:g protein-coupled receptor [Anaeramoeba flamelloides]KAJ6236187.1 g protein-coupled receptor [Anaeramoeba flamelloides]